MLKFAKRIFSPRTTFKLQFSFVIISHSNLCGIHKYIIVKFFESDKVLIPYSNDFTVMNQLEISIRVIFTPPCWVEKRGSNLSMIWNETNDSSFSNLVHMLSWRKISDFVKIDETLFNFTSTLVQRDSGSQTEEDYSSSQVRGFRFDQSYTSHLFQPSVFPHDFTHLTF